MSDHKLAFGPALSSYFERVSPELGTTNAKRLEQFLQVEPEADCRYRLDKVFAALLPNQEKAIAQKNFERFRKMVNEAAETSGCNLCFHMDTSRLGDLSKRFCWFEIVPSGYPELKHAATSGKQVNPSRAQKLQAILQRPVYEVFGSYAHRNGTQADSLLDHLEKRLDLLTVVKPYSAQIWMDTHIAPGDRWREEIENALTRADLGLFFLSVEFFSSDFIQKTEVPTFLKDVSDTIKSKVAIPVMVCDFSINTYAESLGGMGGNQIFRYTHTNGRSYAWNETRTEVIKNKFADELASLIVKRLDEIHESR